MSLACHHKGKTTRYLPMLFDKNISIRFVCKCSFLSYTHKHFKVVTSTKLFFTS
ncbi:hypothetical protein Hanom_Chr16g01509321 [Helianthus anomalus]